MPQSWLESWTNGLDAPLDKSVSNGCPTFRHWARQPALTRGNGWTRGCPTCVQRRWTDNATYGVVASVQLLSSTTEEFKKGTAQ